MGRSVVREQVEGIRVEGIGRGDGKLDVLGKMLDVLSNI